MRYGKKKQAWSVKILCDRKWIWRGQWHWHDEIISDMFKYRGKQKQNKILTLFTDIIEEQKIPIEWQREQKTHLENYRGITLLNLKQNNWICSSRRVFWIPQPPVKTCWQWRGNSLLIFLSILERRLI